MLVSGLVLPSFGLLSFGCNFLIIGAYFAINYNPKIVSLIGGCLFLSKYYFSSIIHEKWNFYVWNALLDSIGLSSVFVCAVRIISHKFPERKGILMSIIASASGIGSAIFSIIAMKIVNPDNKDPTIEVIHGKITERFYDDTVTKNYPKS